MAKAYSMDLRRRVIADANTDLGTLEHLAYLLAIST